MTLNGRIGFRRNNSGRSLTGGLRRSALWQALRVAAEPGGAAAFSTLLSGAAWA
jgi:hypothetical protein